MGEKGIFLKEAARSQNLLAVYTSRSKGCEKSDKRCNSENCFEMAMVLSTQKNNLGKNHPSYFS